MENLVGNITYIEPVSKFKKVNKTLMEKYDPLTVGIYCKIIVMSSKCNLNIKFIASALGVSKAKARSTIVFLESEGYIKRVPVKNENGHMKGWQYFVYPEQLPIEERSNAGKKNDDSSSRVVGSPCCRKSDNTENDKDIYKDYKENNKDLNKEKEKNSINIEKKNGAEAPVQSEDERYFYSYMKEHCPFVYKMQVPMTYEQYKKACSKYSREKIWKALDAMNNWKELNKKRRYAYKTLLNWLERDNQQYK